MQGCQVLNAITQLQQLSFTTDRPILWYTLMRVLASHANYNGCLESVDWTTGLEYWNGLNCYKSLFLGMTTF